MPPSRKHDSAVLLNRLGASLATSAYASFPDVDAAVGFQDEDALIVVGEDGGERGNVVREVGAVSQIVEPFPRGREESEWRDAAFSGLVEESSRLGGDNERTARIDRNRIRGAAETDSRSRRARP